MLSCAIRKRSDFWRNEKSPNFLILGLVEIPKTPKEKEHALFRHMLRANCFINTNPIATVLMART